MRVVTQPFILFIVFFSCSHMIGILVLYRSGSDSHVLLLVVFLGVNINYFASRGWYTSAQSRNNISMVETARMLRLVRALISCLLGC